MSISDANKQGIREAILAGKKIEAIKTWRELTGAGLAEAKAAIEAIEAELRAGGGGAGAGAAAPSGPERRTGCLGLLVACLVVIFSVLLVLHLRPRR